MANWCSNSLEFQGIPESLTAAHFLLAGMRRSQKITGEGQLPPWSALTDGYFFELENPRDAPQRFEYETRWSPNTIAVVEIADRFGLGFLLHYEQRGDLLFGFVRYAGGKLEETRLDAKDFNSYRYDETTGCYRYQGQWLEDVLEIWKILLARKM